jgi:putative membrane protein
MLRIMFATTTVMLSWLFMSATQIQAQQERALPRTQTLTDDSPLTDEMFVKKALASGKVEVELARMALQQSNDAQIKQFAQEMIRDHSKVDKELLAATGERQPESRTEGGRRPGRTGMLDRESQRILDQFTQLRGPEFDRAFTRQVVKDHEKAVSLFQKEAKNGQNASLKSLAESTLPTLKEHLKSAQDLARNIRTESRQR